MAEREECCAKSCPSVSWLPKMIRRRELHGSSMSRLTRLVAEGVLRGVRKKPSYVQKVSFIRFQTSFLHGKTNICRKSYKYKIRHG